MKIVLLGLLFSLLTQWAAAAEGDLSQRAQQAYANEDWTRAASLYAELARADTENLTLWLRLARARTQMGDFEGAADAIGNAARLNPNHPFVAAFDAVNLHAQEQFEGAFNRLSEATRNGLTPQMMETHPALTAMRDHPRFQEILASAEQIAYPCQHQPEYQAFLFWVGDWDVYSSLERIGPAGRNVITRDMKGCMIRERWGMVNGAEASGESYNFYDPISQTWRQLWLDNSGNIIRYEGKFVDGAMRMKGTNVSAKGVVQQARVTWTPMEDGVHHVIELFDDAKGEWTSAFNGYYFPRTPTE